MAVAAGDLRGGVDYPRTRPESDAFFPDDGSRLEYLERLRWREGFVCPRCRTSATPWRASQDRLVCPGCRTQTSVLANTLFYRTRTPLRLWLMAAWEMTSQKYGTNALGVQRVLGLGSYQTAWAWLHRFRSAMVRPPPLSGPRSAVLPPARTSRHRRSHPDVCPLRRHRPWEEEAPTALTPTSCGRWS